MKKYKRPISLKRLVSESSDKAMNFFEFSPSFPKDLQRKINLYFSKKSDDKFVFVNFVQSIVELAKREEGSPEELLNAWWGEMIRKGLGKGLGIDVPDSSPWRMKDLRIDVFNDGREVGGECEIFEPGNPHPDNETWRIIYMLYLTHDYCWPVFMDTMLEVIGRTATESWLDDFLREKGIAATSISKTMGMAGDEAELFDELYDCYAAKNLFFPIEVNSGRKFKGMGYVISSRHTNYSFSGHHVSATTYTVWDPVNRRTGEFNCNENIIGIHKNPSDLRYASDKFKMNFNMDVYVMDDEKAKAFKDFIMDIVNRAKAKCGSDYRYMKNYINVCTERMLPWDLLDKVIETLVKTRISESQRITLTIGQIKRLVKECNGK